MRLFAVLVLLAGMFLALDSGSVSRISPILSKGMKAVELFELDFSLVFKHFVPGNPSGPSLNFRFVNDPVLEADCWGVGRN